MQARQAVIPGLVQPGVGAGLRDGALAGLRDANAVARVAATATAAESGNAFTAASVTVEAVEAVGLAHTQLLHNIC